MKKVLAIAALIIGSGVVIFALSVLNLFLFFYLSGGGVVAAVALTAGAAFGIGKLRAVFEKKLKLSYRRFILCAYAPSASASAVYLIVVLILDQMKYFKGFLGGFGEFVTGLSWLITSVVAALSGIIILGALSSASEDM